MFPILAAFLLAAWLIQPWSYVDAPAGGAASVPPVTIRSAQHLPPEPDDVTPLKHVKAAARAAPEAPAAPEPTQETAVLSASLPPVQPLATIAPLKPSNALEELICSYPWPCEEALRVKWCESRANWDTIGSGANYGGFQINQVHARRFPDFWESWMDPEKNTAWAFQIWSEQGWRPWACRPR
jgi:hypothetical protein